MKEKHYYVCKNESNKKVIHINYDKLEGFGFLPRNNVKYSGIVVNKLLLVKPSMIEKILKKKIKRKLDVYLNLMIDLTDSEEGTDSTSMREALDDLSKYRSIVEYKYRKYLDEKYFKIVTKKISVLEYELNSRLINMNDYIYEEEKKSRRSK